MLKVGLTGGIGSGKSTVARIFLSLGVPVFFADDASKKIMSENPDVKRRLIQAFGEATYVEGRLNTKYLSGIVFQEKARLEQLNSIVHPATIEYANDWMQRQTAPYIIKEAALLFESGSYRQLDLVIGVSAPLESRIRWVMQRDGVTRSQVEARMSQQMPEAEKLARCDFLIYNDGKESLEKQVTKLHLHLLDRAGRGLIP